MKLAFPVIQLENFQKHFKCDLLKIALDLQAHAYVIRLTGFTFITIFNL